jgi:hypothetical protein
VSHLADPPQVKYFLAAFGQDQDLLGQAIDALSRDFDGGSLGQPDFRSPPRPISETTYYDREMGPNLAKIYLSWPGLASPDRLVSLKLAAMSLEKELADSAREIPRRRVNLDPGYVFSGGLILSTGKFAGHRLYLGERVWGELTLYYRRGFQALPWTYRDYQDPDILGLLSEMRKAYWAALRKT